jgi:hypothetical protein
MQASGNEDDPQILLGNIRHSMARLATQRTQRAQPRVVSGVVPSRSVPARCQAPKHPSHNTLAVSHNTLAVSHNTLAVSRERPVAGK